MQGLCADLVQIEGAFQQLRPQGVLLLVGMQQPLGIQKTLRQSSKHLPQPKVVPVGVLGTQHISSQHLHACKSQLFTWHMQQTWCMVSSNCSLFFTRVTHISLEVSRYRHCMLLFVGNQMGQFHAFQSVHYCNCKQKAMNWKGTCSVCMPDILAKPPGSHTTPTCLLIAIDGKAHEDKTVVKGVTTPIKHHFT